MNQKVKRLGTVALLVASLSAGALVVGAQDATPTPADPAAQATQPTRPGRENSPLYIVATQLGIEPAALMTELQAGKTVTQLAEEKGVSLDAITEAIVTARETLLTQAVTDGRLTQAQADARLALLKADLSAMYDRVWDAQTDGRGPGGMGGDGFAGPDNGFGGPGRGQGGQGGRGHGGPGGFGRPNDGAVPPADAPAAEATVTPNA